MYHISLDFAWFLQCQLLTCNMLECIRCSGVLVPLLLNMNIISCIYCSRLQALVCSIRWQKLQMNLPLKSKLSNDPGKFFLYVHITFLVLNQIGHKLLKYQIDISETSKFPWIINSENRKQFCLSIRLCVTLCIH